MWSITKNKTKFEVKNSANKADMTGQDTKLKVDERDKKTKYGEDK